MSKIAVIDDDPDIVEATRIILESKGFTVVSAVNVEEALDLVDNENPDLIILDVMLVEPDDGFYLANKFRRKGIIKPIIMLTSVSKVFGYDSSVVKPSLIAYLVNSGRLPTPNFSIILRLLASAVFGLMPS